MLQISERRSVLKIPKSRMLGCVLKLGIIHHQSEPCIASRCCKDRDGLKQSIRYRVGEKSALHIFHRRVHGGWVEEIAFDDFRPLFTQLVRASIKFMDEGANRNTLFE